MSRLMLEYTVLIKRCLQIELDNFS